MRDWRIEDKEVNNLNIAIVGLWDRWKGPWKLWFYLHRDFKETL